VYRCDGRYHISLCHRVPLLRGCDSTVRRTRTQHRLFLTLITSKTGFQRKAAAPLCFAPYNFTSFILRSCDLAISTTRPTTATSLRFARQSQHKRRDKRTRIERISPFRYTRTWGIATISVIVYTFIHPVFVRVLVCSQPSKVVASQDQVVAPKQNQAKQQSQAKSVIVMSLSSSSWRIVPGKGLMPVQQPRQNPMNPPSPRLAGVAHLGQGEDHRVGLTRHQTAEVQQQQPLTSHNHRHTVTNKTRCSSTTSRTCTNNNSKALRRRRRSSAVIRRRLFPSPAPKATPLQPYVACSRPTPMSSAARRRRRRRSPQPPCKGHSWR